MGPRRKQGDIREDGMVFWCYHKQCRNGEYWVTPEKFAEKRGLGRERNRARYANDPAFRAEQAAYNAAYKKKRIEDDPIFAAKVRLRRRTRQAFNRIAADKPASTQELLGSDWQTLKAHIESQFVDNMSWENMSDWHIDHIIPLASANTEEELTALCHYTNLQPLWAADNLRKGARLPEQPNLVG